jgi:butyrate response factor 1
MKLKKGGDFSVFSSNNIMAPAQEIQINAMPGPKFDPFSFVNKESVSAWTEVDSSIIAPNTANLGDEMSPSIELGLSEFNDSFMEGEEGWLNNAELQADLSLKGKKNKKAPVVEEKAVIEEELSKQNLYKTELCRSFQDTGICRYGHKCQFAHGVHEIRPVMRHPKYKTEVCKKFASTGQCPYGVRCRFIHPLANAPIAPVMASPPSVVWSNSWATPQAAEEKKSSKKSVPAPIGTPPGADHGGDATARRLAFFQSIASY